jgi:hypothetical protein
VSRYPPPAPVHDLILLFLPPCGPHLTPLATWSLKPSLLVSPLLRGPARQRPFTLALHLHQRKSSRNLHLDYSAKSQSITRYQSLITARSDHPPVLRRSDPQKVPQILMRRFRKWKTGSSLMEWMIIWLTRSSSSCMKHMVATKDKGRK